MIPESIVDEIRARADIVEVVGEQVPLKRAGKDFSALCPFHHEKTPSFYVVPSKGFYKCFGCGESGDVFTFLMKRAGLSFQDAVRDLGHRVGVEVPDPRIGRELDEPNRILYEAVAFAEDYFRRNLADETIGAKARKYLSERGISETAIDRFKIGYAPDAMRSLREEAHKHDLDDEILLAAGIIKESDRGDEPYDRFRDRIVFPIAELGGRTIAFGGRILQRNEKAPKYLNSPEIAIYHKGELLYGLNWSKGAIRREGVALVVEGYMDYVALASRGIENVVAGMGTALTEAQANLIARYTGKAQLLYDSDAAGLKATFRTADALLRVGVHPLVVTLPDGEDPDSIVRRGGADALRPHLDDAMDVIEKKVQMMEQRGFFDDIEGVRRALDRLLPTLRATVDPALRDIYTSRVSQRTGVRRETLEKDLDRVAVTAGPPQAQSRSPHRPVRHRESVADRLEAERLLLKVLISDRSRIADAQATLNLDHIHDPRHREILRAIMADPEAEKPTLSSSAAPVWDGLVGKIAEIIDGATTYGDILVGLDLEDLDLQERYIEAQLSACDESEMTPIVQKKMELARKRQQLTASAQLGFKAGRMYRRARENRGPDVPPTPE